MAAWQGCTELSAGEMAEPCYVPALAGARPRGGVGPCFPGLHVAIKDGNVSPMPCPSDVQNKTVLGQSLGIECFCQITQEENPRRKAVVVLDLVPSLPCCVL